MRHGSSKKETKKLEKKGKNSYAIISTINNLSNKRRKDLFYTKINTGNWGLSNTFQTPFFR